MYEFSEEIWNRKYRWKESSYEGTMERVAKAAANVEKTKPLKQEWADKFKSVMVSNRFLPGGRILYTLGTDRYGTSMNCFVIKKPTDNIKDIYRAILDAGLVTKSGGGVGFNISQLRPTGSPLSGGGHASGPISFLKVFNASSGTILIGSRRAANIAILNVDHPDIFNWLEAKRVDGQLDQFNISIGIVDGFAKALQNNDDWNLVFGGKVYKTVKAREIFDKFCECAWKFNDPGIFHIENVNKFGTGGYIEHIDSPNPCGEQPLFENTACCLGAVNLPAFVENPFTSAAKIDYQALDETVRVAVRMLDNVIDVSTYPLADMADKVSKTRRIGIGSMGLGNLFAMMRVKYGSKESMDMTSRIWSKIRFAAYMESAKLGAEKGSFHLFDKEKHFECEYFKRFGTKELQQIMAIGAMRNTALLTCAPTGTTAIIAGNISGGIEPIFAKSFKRKVKDDNKPDVYHTRVIEDYAWRLYNSIGKPDGDNPEYFAEANEISWRSHLDIQEVTQKYVDSAISKTINMPEDITLEEYKQLMEYVIVHSELKGITTYVARGDRDSILSKSGTVENVRTEQIQLFPATLKRPIACHGTTYKIPYAHGSSIYVTINSNDDINKKLFEVFIECKNGKGKPWDAVTSRMLSALFRRLPDNELEFIINELKEIRDPDSGVWFGEQYIHSPSHAVAIAVEMFLGRRNTNSQTTRAPNTAESPKYELCPECHEYGVITDQGCQRCQLCGWTKCDGSV